MAEALVKVLSQSLTSLIQDEFGVLWGVKKDLQKLEKTLKRINVVLEAADEHQFSNKELKNWLEDLVEVAHEADDVVDEFATTKAQQSRASGICAKQVCKFIPSPLCFKNIWFRHKIGHKLQAVIKCLDECEAKRPSSHGREGSPSRGSQNWQGRETDSFVLESEVYGREKDKEKIVELLLTSVNSQDNLSIIPIVGMGGVGKTTLAQLVYNDTRVKDCFELTIWVCVSEDFDHRRLVTTITQFAGGGRSDDTSVLKKNLQEKLKGKKFLLVLDDVWNDKENEWERLKHLLTCGGKGSSVLVTTRSKRVAQIMGTVLDHYDLMGLSMDDCWSLFRKRAFWEGRREEHPKLVEIGKEIVKKCKGVPLAAKTLGSLMRFKSTDEDEWLSIQESELWQTLPEDQDDVFPALRLSYINLPHQLRRCFVFCSVFPKDYEMKKEELVHLWMANGLVQYRRERELEDSYETFNELLGRSFFQDIKKDEFGDVRACKIHDLMHDLAKSVSRDECYSIDSKEATDFFCERTKHLHVSYRPLLSTDSTPTMILDVAKRLRSLIFDHDRYPFRPFNEETVLARYILKFEFLRVLSVSRGSIRKIPSCIGSLKHLRCLNFSRTSIESLPKSIGNLLNLQILKLRDCRGLEELPESISNLGNLQILDLWNCCQLRHLPKELRKMRSLKHLNSEGTGLTHMPVGIGHLRNLQTLPLFVVGENEGCLIKELRELDRIKGNLLIEGLSNVACARDALDASLRRKPNLDTLGLFWQQRDGEEKQRDEEVLDGLQPHSNLKELSIDGSRGLRFPHWLQASSLPNLVELKLLNCTNYAKLPSLGQLPSLISLHIKGLYGVKYIGNELYRSCERRGFPSLKILLLEDMQNLEVISVEEGREHFPSLKELWLVDMPKLKMLSIVEGREDFPRLRELRIYRCHKLTGIPHFPFLSEVILRGCQELMLLPEGLLKKSTHLKSLCIENLEKLVSLGEDVDNLIALKSLEIRDCAKLMSLPQGLKYLKSLEKLYIRNCGSLMSLSEGGLQGLISLKELSIENCDNLSSLFSRGFNTSGSYALKKLEIKNCRALTSLPEGMHHVTALENLVILDCPALTSLPEGILHLTALKEVEINGCPLTSLSEGMHHLTALKFLEIKGCPLTSLPEGMHHLTALEYLAIEGCPLTSLPEGMHHLTTLQYLKIVDCPAPTSFPKGLKCLWFAKCENLTSLPEGILHLTALEEIHLKDCPSLTSLPEGIHHLTSLRYLVISNCRQLSSLPDVIQDATSLQALRIRGCGEELVRRYEKERGADWHKIAHIPYIDIH